jgi:hypothetical protein
MQGFVRVPAVRDRYNVGELWGIVAEGIGTLPMSATDDEIKKRVLHDLSRLTDAPDAVVVVPVANLDPGTTPLEVGPLLIGRLGTK